MRNKLSKIAIMYGCRIRYFHSYAEGGRRKYDITVYFEETKERRHIYLDYEAGDEAGREQVLLDFEDQIKT